MGEDLEGITDKTKPSSMPMNEAESYDNSKIYVVELNKNMCNYLTLTLTQARNLEALSYPDKKNMQLIGHQGIHGNSSRDGIHKYLVLSRLKLNQVARL